MTKKGFESEHLANEFAKEVGGTVKYRALPDYNGVTDYWVVEYEGSEKDAGNEAIGEDLEK